MVEIRRKPVRALLALAIAASMVLVGCGKATPDEGEAITEPTKVTEVSTGGTTVTSVDDADGAMLSELDVTVYTSKGKARKLSRIADGKPLVLNFWASWCPYCVDEMPDFQHIYREYNKKISFAFVDVADGERETVKSARKWLKEQEIDDLPIYFDTSLEAATVFGAHALPTTVLVSEEGEVLTVSAGRIDPAQMRVTLEGLV